MLPTMWNQLPCMNIDDSGVSQFGRPSTQATPSPSDTRVPGATLPRSSPGISPSEQTELASSGSLPRPWSSVQQSALATISAIVTTGQASAWFSSRSGNMRGRV
jgi:hypothetical protein